MGFSLLLCSIAATIHPAVAELSESPARGCLTQYTCHGRLNPGIDPNKMTIVVTHGFNPFPGRMRLTTPEEFSKAIVCRCGEQVNVFGWDWNAATFTSLLPRNNTENAICQGKMLANRLRQLGVRPEKTWLIGHSYGALLMSSAASELAESGAPVARLTLLDAVRAQHRMIFGCRFCVQNKARCVENYWCRGLSGFGKPTRARGVHNRLVRNPRFVRGIVNPLQGNHTYAVEWYYNTICNPRCRDGFNWGGSR